LTIFPQDFGEKTYLKHWRLKTQKKTCETCEILVQHFFFKQTKKRFFGEKIPGKTQIIFLAFVKKNSNKNLIYIF
jgi:hypothetical protein